MFDAKHDGRHRATLVADEHLPNVPLSSVYSGVVLLRGIRIVLFIDELNMLESWGTCIRNACSEAFTKEKVCMIAGPEFGPLQGNTSLINKVSYGIRTSGLTWHERLSDSLSEMGHKPWKMEPDMWLRDCGEYCEHIAFWADDLIMNSKDPQRIVDTLMSKHHFKFKGTGPM